MTDLLTTRSLLGGKAGLVLLTLLVTIILVRRFSRVRHSRAIGWTTIPQPPSLPIVKHLFQINPKEPLSSIAEIAKRYQDVCRISIPGISMVIINSHRLYDEVCDTKRFHKEPVGALGVARVGVGDSLLTAFSNEESWQIAHRVIGPMYGQNVVKHKFDEMYDMTSTLVDHFTELGPNEIINPYKEFTKISLATIARTALDLDLDCIKSKRVPKFADDMTFFMSQSGKRSLRPALVNDYVLRDQDRLYRQSIRDIRSLGEEAIRKREASGEMKMDVLGAMLNNPDPVTGKKMTRTSIVDNAVVLMGAGYETTASLLSWSLITILKHPRCLSVLRDELKTVLGPRRIEAKDLDSLPYLLACLRETSRLYPGVYAHSVKLREDVDPALGGLGDENYLVRREDTVRINLQVIQRDPLVWGNDAEEFVPERMLNEKFQALPKNSWKPFGNRNRICPGRFFAMQEASVVLATLLQKFDFEFVDGRCDCHIGQTLILVPINCTMKVRRRKIEA